MFTYHKVALYDQNGPSRINKQLIYVPTYFILKYEWNLTFTTLLKVPDIISKIGISIFFKGRIDLPPQLICYGLTDESSVYYWLNFFVFILFWWNVVKLYYTFAVPHFHEVSSCFEKQKSFFNSLSTYFLWIILPLRTR